MSEIDAENAHTRTHAGATNPHLDHKRVVQLRVEKLKCGAPRRAAPRRRDGRAAPLAGHRQLSVRAGGAGEPVAGRQVGCLADVDKEDAPGWMDEVVSQVERGRGE